MKVGDKVECPKCQLPDAIIQFEDDWQFGFRCCDCETSGGFHKQNQENKEK